MNELSFFTMLLLGLFGAFAQIEFLGLRIFQLGRPLMSATIAGLIVGDVPMGLAVGATLELLALGVYNYGGAPIPDYTTGAILGVAFGHLGGLTPTSAVGLAVPIAVLAGQIDILTRVGNAFLIHRADHAAEKGDYKAIEKWHLLGMIPWGLSRFIPIFFGLYFGSTFVENIVAYIPEWLTNGLKTAGGILPALGIGMLLVYLPIKKFWPFLIVGFVLAAYLNLSLIGVSLFAAALAMLVVSMNKKPESA
jgi:PTS system mannose-specific IIC component